ncbi:hypothetical protein [Methylibium sp.]|uniref:hypothetical protein n=1 Tax=Methylibium sp. TaxID=2067992 RepID=UPI003BA992CF
MFKNFPCTDDGQAITATGSSAVTAFAAAGAAFATDVMIDNPGPVDIYFRVGGVGVAATTASRRVPAGAQVVYEKGQATHIALLSAGANQGVVVAVGKGI